MSAPSSTLIFNQADQGHDTIEANDKGSGLVAGGHSGMLACDNTSRPTPVMSTSAHILLDQIDDGTTETERSVSSSKFSSIFDGISLNWSLSREPGISSSGQEVSTTRRNSMKANEESSASSGIIQPSATGPLLDTPPIGTITKHHIA